MYPLINWLLITLYYVIYWVLWKIFISKLFLYLCGIYTYLCYKLWLPKFKKHLAFCIYACCLTCENSTHYVNIIFIETTYNMGNCLYMLNTRVYKQIFLINVEYCILSTIIFLVHYMYRYAFCIIQRFILLIREMCNYQLCTTLSSALST